MHTNGVNVTNTNVLQWGRGLNEVSGFDVYFASYFLNRHLLSLNVDKLCKNVPSVAFRTTSNTFPHIARIQISK